MERFVCVRVVQGWGMDLSLFQFDYRLETALFFLNAERTIYGRFSPRDDHNIERLKKSLEAVLRLHEEYPRNKDALASKRGRPLPWKTSQEIPQLSKKGKPRRFTGAGKCIHCHQVGSGLRKSLPGRDDLESARWDAPYPSPARIGVTMDEREPATVRNVASGGTAEAAGIRAGDRLLSLGGQPLVSIADLEWALFTAGPSGPLAGEAERDGKTVAFTLDLPADWRTRKLPKN